MGLIIIKVSLIMLYVLRFFLSVQSSFKHLIWHLCAALDLKRGLKDL